MSHGSYSSQSASIMTETRRGEDYVKGGYHPVKIGDTFSDGRYVVVRKLGWGHFSTVWLAKDQKMNRHVALKVVKSAPRYTETALDEIKLLQRLITSSTPPIAPTPSNPSPPPSPAHTHPGVHMSSLFSTTSATRVPMASTSAWSSRSSARICSASSSATRTRASPCPRQADCQADPARTRLHRCCGVIHTDLKPENVLICIDDVESIISTELAASSATASTPQTASGGNQTPRSESVFITGSQPLLHLPPFGSSPMLDKWAFGMSKIEGDDSKAKSSTSVDKDALMMKPTHPPSQSTDLAAEVSQVSLDTRGSFIGRVPTKSMDDVELAPGSVMSIDRESDEDSSALYEALAEKITVKIADLGNATWVEHHFTDDIQTRQYRCPEVILGAKWGPSSDLWSVACILFELITGATTSSTPPLERGIAKMTTYRPDHRAVGSFISIACLSNSSSSSRSSGELRHINKLVIGPRIRPPRQIPLPKVEADALAAFLGPMLRLHPDGAPRPPRWYTTTGWTASSSKARSTSSGGWKRRRKLDVKRRRRLRGGSRRKGASRDESVIGEDETPEHQNELHHTQQQHPLCWSNPSGIARQLNANTVASTSGARGEEKRQVSLGNGLGVRRGHDDEGRSACGLSRRNDERS
ncbi:hypothetical protein CPB84DRAFT_1854598 [Gymnopilus junonius]|uniref:non-specific serine/threonine protein kinase n=1 Tax=Gymnopilus junonius TaxID=109634 RepID=A0A9P5N951_GYMJU|nr:hypothetical protein CPB84DRAFT_1854598 [Gymnopilus junonius]